jgi:hypothetical protein
VRLRTPPRRIYRYENSRTYGGGLSRRRRRTQSRSTSKEGEEEEAQNNIVSCPTFSLVDVAAFQEVLPLQLCILCAKANITPAEYSAETVISAEYLPNLNAKYSIRPSVPTSEMNERVNRNLFYFLCRVDTPTTCRAVIGHILGVFEQLFNECRGEFIYNCDFAACL